MNAQIEAQAARLVAAGIPRAHVATTDDEVRVVFTPQEAYRFGVALEVLEETSSVSKLLSDVWA